MTRLFSQQSFANESNIKQLATDQLSAVLTAMQQHLNDQRRVREFAGGINATIIGPPNAGKSTFLNLLCQKYVSTVSPQAGSTTDTIDKTLKIDGVPLALTDTVGLTAQSIGDKMQGGLLNTKNRMDSGDLKICLLDMSTIYQDKSQTAIDPAVLEAIDPDTIVLVNKRDLVNIRIPAPPGKIRYKNSPLSPQGEVQRTAFRGKVPIRLDGDTTGNFVKFGDFGLRVLHDVRLTERCLQECRATLHRYIKSVRGGRFWLRVVPDHPMSAKPIGVRMGKGKGAFDHWEAKVPCKKIVFEIGGGVREETARKIMRIVSARLPGKTEFVVAEKEEMVTDLISRIKEYSKLPPLGVWCISCETGEGVEEFLGDFSDLLRKRYEAALSDENQQPDSRRTLQLQQGVALKDQLSEKPPQMIAQQLIQHLDALIEKPTVKQAVDYLYHAKYGVLRKNEMQQQQQQ